jgi:cytochrome b561
MQIANSQDRYGAISQLLHWVMVLLVITAWLLGQFVDDLPKGALSIHIWVGCVLLLMLFVRAAWRVADPPPRREPQFARGDALSIFGIFEIASPWVKNRVFARSVTEIHEILANMLVILAALHAVAALIHHWVLRDRTLIRMLPGS